MKNKNQIPLYEQVLKTIEGQIVAGVYQQGDLLPSEKDLITTFNVSRITIRKALLILSEMGMIETSKGRGSVVLFDSHNLKKNSGFESIADEYRQNFRSAAQVRLLLEPEIAKEVALTATAQQIKHLQDVMKMSSDSLEHSDFHLSIVEVLNNNELTQWIQHLISMDESNAPKGLIPPEKQEPIHQKLDAQHLKILDAISTRNGEFAYFYMKEHTLYVSEIYETYFRHLY